MDEIKIPMSVVLDLVGGLCPDCGEKVRQRLGREQFIAKHGALKKSLDDILLDVAGQRNVSIEDILSKSAVPSVVDARREVAFRARSHGHSLEKIGELLRRDHSTVSRILEA